MAKRRASKKQAEAREAPAPDTPSRSRGRPWWVVLAVLGVVAVVIAIRFGDGARTTRGQDIVLEEIEMDAPAPPPERLRVRVVRRFPHDTGAFTQGLLWHAGHLYESTGLRGRSTLRKVDLETGEVVQRRSVERSHFGEGLARVDDRLIQLTWMRGVAHVWSVDGFEHLRTFEYEGEGWGLCHDGRNLVMSDGSARLTFRDPSTFRELRRVTVRQEGRAVGYLNELECVDGAIWANVWQREELLRIDPGSGRVTAVVDASGLLSEQERLGTDVLNGIAWIPERDRFVITGKLWPYLFEVELVPVE